MKQVFVDTTFWIAVVSPKDPDHGKAQVLYEDREYAIKLTTQMVLNEFLAAFCSSGQYFRKAAADFVKLLCEHPNVEVVPQTSSMFFSALSFYKDRLDKDWSLVDCASFELMRERSISHVLTRDHHFEQAGFTILMNEQH